MVEKNTFFLGKCQVIPIEYAIKFDQQEKQTLQPKFIDVLCYLAKHYPRVIPRDELIENVWAGNQYVGEKALTNAIWHLRQKLKPTESESQEEVIETIRKVGYRLLVKPQFESQEIANEQHKLVHNPKSTKPHFLIIAFLVSFMLFTVVWHFSDHDINYQDFTITEITKHPGSELFTAPSPDGSKVVFKWSNNSSDSNLFIKDRNNPQLAPKQLTFGDAYVGHSVWSNDGKYLYYARKTKDRDDCQVIQLKMKTHQEKPIVDCPLQGGYYYLDISPDDKTLAFHGFHEPAEDNGIYFIDLTDDTSQPVRFSCSQSCGYKDRDFAFAPDGEHIAVTRRINRFNENIYLVNLKTNESIQLTTGEEDIVGLAWHPEGKKLVYGAQRADIRRGYILDIDSKKHTNLPVNGFSYPAFAKQSLELFYQQRSENYLVASLPLNSKVASTPFPVIDSAFNHHYPHYSAKSEKIAYVSNESGFYELWIADKQGKNREQLTFLQQTIRYPRWSHSGDKIAFLAPTENSQRDKIYIYDMNNQTLSMLPSPHSSHNRPTWAWDDSGIISAVYEKEYVDLHNIDIQTGKSKRISFDGSRYGVMTSPTTLLFTQQEKGLWQKELSENETELNQNNAIQKVSSDAFKTSYSWEYTAQGIFYRKKYSTHYQLTFFNFAKQQEMPLVNLPRNALSANTNMSLIDNQLIFTMAKSPQADIKMLSHPLLK